MKPFAKRTLVGAAVAALLATVVAGREQPSLVAPPEPAARLDASVRLADEIDLALLERRDAPAAQADPFASRSFAPPRPAAAAGKSAPAAKPSAPPLPFAYLGKMIEDGKLAVFLSRGGESYSVSAGDTIGGEYRVEAVTDKEITFTYLPLKTKQRLPL